MNKKFVLVLALAALAIPLSARQRAAVDPAAALARLQWRAIGPANTGGRVTVVEGLAGDPATFYVGTADGGVFKTTNGGTTFDPLFDGQPVLSIGALAVAPSDRNVVWVGTGEGNPRNSVSFGNGVYRSTDAGRTWTHLGLDDTERIARIRVDPRDPDVAWVAALGHEWGANEMRGLFKTTDGGKTWTKVLYLDDDTGCSDVELDPANPRIVYAAMYTYRRRPWRFDSGGRQTSLHKSIDGGATWRRLSNGLPDKPMDRIGIAAAPSQPQTVYIVTEIKDEGSLFRSDDGGESWRVVHRNPQINMRPFYFGFVRVDPVDAERVYVLAGSLSRSNDGGRTFETIGRGVHPDHHALWIDPVNPKLILDGNDGGVYRSWDRGETWEFFNTLPLSQFYHVNYDLRQPYHVCGGLQDNFNWCGPSATTLSEGIRRDDWYTLMFGDGFFAVPDPTAPHLVYNNTQGGVIALSDTRSGNQRSIHPYPNRIGSAGGAIADHKYRFNWNAPIVLSPHDPTVVYFGGNVVFRTVNRGETWDVISPDLTTNDKAKQQSSGGEIVTDNTAAEFHSTILTIAESPARAGVIWVGTDDGNVQVTRDAGRTWTNVAGRIPGLPPASWIPAIEASRFDAGAAYVAVDRHRDDDFAPYAFKTTDYGQTWSPIRGDLPAKGYVHVVREDPRTRNLVYAGTELGVFASWDGGAHWSPIRGNMPAVAVRDLQIHPRDNDLIAATHGRGAWILDDLAPLQQLAAASRTDLHPFDGRPAIRWQTSRTNIFTGDRTFAGPNPSYGAIVDYYLAGDAQDGVTITVTDGGGKPVRQIRNAPGKAGVNRIAWDLRHDAATPARSERSGAGGGFFGGGGGPLAVPGEYRLTIKAGAREVTRTVQVLPDPRIEASAVDLRAQLDAMLELRELTARVNATIDRAADLDAQLEHLSTAIERQPPDRAQAIRQAIAAAREAAREVRGPLTRPAPLSYRYPPGLREELSALGGRIGGSTDAPTPPALERLAELKTETDAAVSAMNAVVEKTVSQINTLAGELPRLVLGGPIR